MGNRPLRLRRSHRWAATACKRSSGGSARRTRLPARGSRKRRARCFCRRRARPHVFGVAMVETFFRAAGWRVKRGGLDFADELAREWFDLVGFSLSGDRHLEVLANAVGASAGGVAQSGAVRAGRRADFPGPTRRWSCASGPTAPPPTRPALFNWRAVCYGGAPPCKPARTKNVSATMAGFAMRLS